MTQSKPDSFHLVLVEDDPDDQFITEQALQDCDACCKLTVFNRGEALLDYLNVLTANDEMEPCDIPSLVVMDLNLPGMNGRDILKTLKQDKRWCYLPVVILTTSTNMDDKDQCYGLGVNTYYSKPTSYPEYVKLMAHLCQAWKTKGG